MSQPLI